MSNKTHINDHQSNNSVQDVTIPTPQFLPHLPLVLTLDEVASLLNTGPKRTAKLLATHGVEPIDYGPGRGGGLRWHQLAIINLMGILHANAQAKSQTARPPKKSSRLTVKGKSASQLFAEFNGNSQTRAEVCNGN